MLFWMTPIGLTAGIYVLAALLPAVWLLRYIYRHDRIEKEPGGLLLALLLRGVAAALIAGLLEELGTAILDFFPIENETLAIVLFAFCVVAVSEEGCKYVLMKSRTWNDPNFDYRFDGIVYAVFVSLGFAGYENILYIVRFGLSVALTRALLAIPGHMSFAVVMGLLYGRARRLENRGYPAAAKLSRWFGYLAAVFLHGFYDACAMVNTTGSMLLFLAFVAVMFWNVFRIVRKESEKDEPLA